jgi:hypothetical protein
MRKINHPWRTYIPSTFTIDPVVNTRSNQFAAYLETLPLIERRQIETAERVFVTRTNWVTGPQQSAARDYAKGMLGVKENEPAEYRGFVV